MKKYIVIFFALASTISVAKISNNRGGKKPYTTKKNKIIVKTKTNNIEVKALVGIGGYLFNNSPKGATVAGSVTVYKTFDLSKQTNIKTFGINVGGGIDLSIQLNKNGNSGTGINISPVTRFSPFVSTELYGQPHKDVRVYSGLDLGIGFKHANSSFSTSYISKIYVGTTYKKIFTAELGFGYPETISLRVGARFGF
ncbi:hypothetical protein [Caviibacter abscessus]|uniref:hypothetical protein n=1 Tax=Caviibacter abscessus TaxID=1766719 RepID=UPI00082B68BA|nr:hypothetical protein [Caviibacter abscessus]